MISEYLYELLLAFALGMIVSIPINKLKGYIKAKMTTSKGKEQ